MFLCFILKTCIKTFNQLVKTCPIKPFIYLELSKTNNIKLCTLKFTVRKTLGKKRH